MTKKHFQAIAAILKQNKQVDGKLDHKAVCNELADLCKRMNANFDRAKFLEACGVE